MVVVEVVCLLDGCGGAFCWTAIEREGSEVVVVVVQHAENEGGRCE